MSDKIPTDEELDAECERIMNLTEEELRAEIAAEGRDWDIEVCRVKSIFECAVADVEFAKWQADFARLLKTVG
jgi:hypothetical protein